LSKSISQLDLKKGDLKITFELKRFSIFCCCWRIQIIWPSRIFGVQRETTVRGIYRRSFDTARRRPARRTTACPPRDSAAAGGSKPARELAAGVRESLRWRSPGRERAEHTSGSGTTGCQSERQSSPSRRPDGGGGGALSSVQTLFPGLRRRAGQKSWGRSKFCRRIPFRGRGNARGGSGETRGTTWWSSRPSRWSCCRTDKWRAGRTLTGCSEFWGRMWTEIKSKCSGLLWDESSYFSWASFSKHFFYLSQAFVKAKLLIIPF